MDAPKYIALKRALIEEMSTGVFKPGDIFYTEKELMSKHKLSYVTVARAMRELSDEGYFVRKKKKGTIVVERGKGEKPKERSFSETLYLNGLDYAQIKTVMPISWFVCEQIQKGIINTYPGPVRMVSADDIMDRLGKSGGVHAILISPKRKYAEKLEKSKIPYVVIDHNRDLCMTRNSVTWEMIFGVYDLMSYLIRLGHRRIGYVGGERNIFHADRYAMYETALRAYGIPLEERYVLRGLTGYEEEGNEAMRKLMALPAPPTAVFVDTDIKALGAVKAAKELGLRVPEDVSVAGFDDIPGLLNHTPHLTTVRIPCYEIGEEAVRMLMKRVDNGYDQDTVVMKSSLVIRDSCASPAGAAGKTQTEGTPNGISR